MRMAPPIELLEAADQPQGRGLARARRAEQRDELALGDDQRDIVDRDDRPVGPPDALELEGEIACTAFPSPRTSVGLA